LAAIGAVVVALGYLILASLTSVSGLIVPAGFLVGLGWGTFYLAAPMSVSERVTDADRGFWFTRFGAFQMAGIGGGPVVALAMVNSLGLTTAATFRWISLVCAVAGVCLWVFEVLDPRPAGDPGAASDGQHGGWVSSLLPLARTRAIYPMLMVGLGAAVFTGMMTFQSSLVRGTGLSPGLYFTVYAVIVVAARFLLAPAINKADGNKMSVLLLSLMCAGVAAFLAIRLGLALQVLSAILLGLGYGLVYSVIQTQVVNDAPPEHRTGALTWFVVAYFVGIFGFPVIGAWLIVKTGTQAFLAVVLSCGVAELALALMRSNATRRAWEAK
jgi:MFS family permease